MDFYIFRMVLVIISAMKCVRIPYSIYSLTRINLLFHNFKTQNKRNKFINYISLEKKENKLSSIFIIMTQT